MDVELLSVAENVYDGWYTDTARIDWQDFIDRLEKYSGVDMGSDMMSPQIRAVKRHIAAYRRME